MADPLSELEQEYYDQMLPLARHEFGHYAIAKHSGFQTFGVKIAAKAALHGPGGEAEIAVRRPITTIAEMRTYCEDRVRVLSAGVLAEAMERGRITNESAILYAKTSGANDYAKAREHLRILHNIDHPRTVDEKIASKELNAIYDRLWSEASVLVKRYAELIEGLADEIVRRDAKAFQSPTMTETELSKHAFVLKYFP